MLQSQVAQLVAARDQEMKLGVTAGSEQGTALADHPAVELDNLGCEPQSRRRFGCEVEKRGRIGPGRQRDGSHVLARDQRRIGQRGERRAWLARG